MARPDIRLRALLLAALLCPGAEAAAQTYVVRAGRLLMSPA